MFLNNYIMELLHLLRLRFVYFLSTESDSAPKRVKHLFAAILQNNFPNVDNSTTFVNSLMNITIVLKFIFIIDAFREYNSHLKDITS